MPPPCANYSGKLRSRNNRRRSTSYERPAKGGAIASLSRGLLTLTNTTFVRNAARTCAQAVHPGEGLQCMSGSGGAVALQQSSAALTGCSFEGNVAESGGHDSGSTGGALAVVGPPEQGVLVRRCRFSRNEARGALLGASPSYGAAGHGGAVFIVSGSVSFTGTLFENNTAHGGERKASLGGAVAMTAGVAGQARKR